MRRAFTISAKSDNTGFIHLPKMERYYVFFNITLGLLPFIKPRLHIAKWSQLFFTSGISTIYFPYKTRVKHNIRCFSRELFLVKGCYAALFHVNLGVLVNSPKNHLAKITLVKSPNNFGQLVKWLWSTRQIPLVNLPKKWYF